MYSKTDKIKITIHDKADEAIEERFESLFSQYQTAIFFMIFWDFLMFYQIFLSPQVKLWAIIPYKDCV